MTATPTPANPGSGKDNIKAVPPVKQQAAPAKGAAAKANPDVSTILSKIILLESEIRKAKLIKEFAFTAVNDTHRVVPYFQCYLWRRNSLNKVIIEAVSGSTHTDPNTPIIRTIKKIVKFMDTKISPPVYSEFNATAEEVKFLEQWTEFVPPHTLWVPFAEKDEKFTHGGLIFFRETPFSKRDLVALKPLADAYRYSWFNLPEIRKQQKSVTAGLTKKRFFKYAILFSLIAVMFIPVRESILAKAKIIPLSPILVSPEINGVVREFFVSPNEAVVKDQPLFALDDTESKAEVSIAKKQLETAKAEYLLAAQNAFSDEQSKNQVSLLKARVEQRVLEAQQALDRLNRSVIRASRNGIAFFSDANDWLGVPVSVGEKVIVLSDPKEKEIEILVPVGDALFFEDGAEVKLFLNTDPTNPVTAEVRQTSYEPTPTQDQTLAYKIKASIIEDNSNSRLGWQGTAKIYSKDRVTLFYFLFRRPISTLRQLIGF